MAVKKLFTTQTRLRGDQSSVSSIIGATTWHGPYPSSSGFRVRRPRLATGHGDPVGGDALEQTAELLLAGLAVYFGIGVVFAAAFVLRGVERIDSAADGSGAGFRLLILPGCAALWPLLARRWRRGATPPEERNAHRRAARSAEAPPS